MRRYIERKLRTAFLRYFRDDLRFAYDCGYMAGLGDAVGLYAGTATLWRRRGADR